MMNSALADKLEGLRLTVQFRDGQLELIAANGVNCFYSNRYFVPVVAMGFADDLVQVRVLRRGVDELKIAGEAFQFDDEGGVRHPTMAIPE